MRATRLLYAGGRAVASKGKKALSRPLVSSETGPTFELADADDEDGPPPAGFTGRVHSESYSALNLSAAFDSILSSASSAPRKPPPPPSAQPAAAFLAAVQHATLPTLEAYRSSILESLALDDPTGRIYSKNVRQMKDILAYEKWRKKLQSVPGKGPASRSTKARLAKQQQKEAVANEADENTSTAVPEIPAPDTTAAEPTVSVRKDIFERPTVADVELVKMLINSVWKLPDLRDATVIVSFAGYPTLIDELLKLKNVKKVIAIEETPEYCIMYTDRWKEEAEKKRFFHIKNNGYWWESYSEVEEAGLLDDVEIVPWNRRHPSLFFICQLPHHKRSLQFIMQLISFIPNRNWLFQYGRLGMGFVGSGELCQRLTRKQTDLKYTRIAATTTCLADISSAPKDALTPSHFFPTAFDFYRPPSAPRRPTKVYKSSIAASPPPFADARMIVPRHDLDLKPDEFECLNFLQRIMFIHSAQSWVESISFAAAGASIMYTKLKEQSSGKTGEENVYIPKSKTPRSMSREDWINLSKCFAKWPFRPKSFENDLEMELDEGPGV